MVHGMGVPEVQEEAGSLEHERSTDGVHSDVEISLDDIFDILKNERRRRVLLHLRATEGPVSIRELSETIAAYENDKPAAQLRSDERKRVYVGLYQCHLPKMADHGFVRFDKGRGQISLNEATAAQAFEYLDNSGTTNAAWAPYYLALAGIGWALFIIGAGLRGSVTTGLAAVLVLTFVAGTLLIVAHQRQVAEG